MKNLKTLLIAFARDLFAPARVRVSFGDGPRGSCGWSVVSKVPEELHWIWYISHSLEDYICICGICLPRWKNPHSWGIKYTHGHHRENIPKFMNASWQRCKIFNDANISRGDFVLRKLKNIPKIDKDLPSLLRLACGNSFLFTIQVLTLLIKHFTLSLKPKSKRPSVAEKLNHDHFLCSSRAAAFSEQQWWVQQQRGSHIWPCRNTK